jgi:hypothetical protein
MPKYLCDYCDVHLNFSSQSGRKQHNRGRKHQENVRGYYQQYAQALAQAQRGGANIGTTNAFGVTILPPSSANAAVGNTVAPATTRPPPFHPYAPPAPTGPLVVRTLGPAVSGIPAGLHTSTPQQTPSSSFRPNSLPPPPNPYASLPPTNTPAYPSYTSSSPLPPSSVVTNVVPLPSKSGGFINQARASALGLHDHH